MRMQGIRELILSGRRSEGQSASITEIRSIRNSRSSSIRRLVTRKAKYQYQKSVSVEVNKSKHESNTK